MYFYFAFCSFLLLYERNWYQHLGHTLIKTKPLTRKITSHFMLALVLMSRVMQKWG